MRKLREPFDENEIEFRIGATNKDKTKGLALAYVQARAIQNRLDELFGIDGWVVTYREVTAGFICSLSIKINDKWITKEDGAATTEYESVKGGISNAFKRVASSGFGIGRYLYKMKNQWYPIKQQGNSYTFIETPKLNGEGAAREIKSKNIETKDNHIYLARCLQISFGKYSGFTLGEIFDKDRQYFRYLKENSKDRELRNACEILSETAA